MIYEFLVLNFESIFDVVLFPKDPLNNPKYPETLWTLLIPDL